jgi:predicted component of type VI protein secretion system
VVQHLRQNRVLYSESKQRREPKAANAAVGFSNELRLLLKCVDPQTVISVPIKEQNLIVGRQDGDFVPDIDLNGANGEDCGVSRRHAVFTLRDSDLYLEDLNSLNGTMINGFQLVPAKSYLLRNGDEIEFGALRMTVSVVRLPFR